MKSSQWAQAKFKGKCVYFRRKLSALPSELSLEWTGNSKLDLAFSQAFFLAFLRHSAEIWIVTTIFDDFNRKYTFRAFKWARFDENWLRRSGDTIFDRQFSFINAISSSFYKVLESELFNLNFNSCAFKFLEKIVFRAFKWARFDENWASGSGDMIFQSFFFGSAPKRALWYMQRIKMRLACIWRNMHQEKFCRISPQKYTLKPAFSEGLCTFLQCPEFYMNF